MARKDVPDYLVCRAYEISRKHQVSWPYELLMSWTGEPMKVCYRAMERAESRGLIEYGVTLRSGRLTAAGKALLEEREIDTCI